ncbi:enoyl-[acyl-carrier-protein] reductase FabV [Bermanella sp. WJH001]|uniref:enoyl-[acyl-carrier-protein] reductase FabV n=1 Tax=Bermanella sp. WJH001 TaxID=3048005 RepID=UPI0024BE2486|nr:enoyl-[acyl-carrier-protein] reductase FabV [Bermanella sp. WJH001]MDJ1536647.1 enoyl-[acyl-carrier-protein] reductase FabV [Bermanella sp. WJH001]
MSYQPRIKNNICTNAHPVGCYYSVYQQVQNACDNKFQGMQGKTALVIGASSGIGLASRIALTFSAGMDTLGVYCDRAAQAHKYGSAGWYNNQAFEYYARRADKMALSCNQDAFQRNAKDWVVQKLQQSEKQIDVLVYSLAAPKRNIKGVGEYTSAIKPINASFSGKTLDVYKGEMREIEIPSASHDEIDATVKVMGGEDWQEWVNTLKKAGVLAPNFKTIAYSYLGPDQTQEIYGQGTLGRAKAHLHETAIALDQNLKKMGGSAHIGLLQALVTPSSSVIPSLPLYIAALNQEQKRANKYETTLQQVTRLLSQHVFKGSQTQLRLRVDDLERDSTIQANISALLNQVNNDNLHDLVDVDSLKQQFLQQFGFAYDFIDYGQKPDPLTPPAIHDFSQLVGMKKAG